VVSGSCSTKADWYLVLGAWNLVLGSWFLVLGSWFLVLGSSHLLFLLRDFQSIHLRVTDHALIVIITRYSGLTQYLIAVIL